MTIGTDANNQSVKVRLNAVVNPPRIGENGHWYIWSMSANAYVDSGVVSRGDRGAAFTYADFTAAQLEALKGVGIVRTEIKYCVADNQEADVRTLEWQSDIPTVPVGKWLWTKVMLYYSNSDNYAFYTRTQRAASAYETAKAGGYTGTEAQFMALLASVANNTNVWLTEDEYDALQEKDPNVTYNIYEEV
ncbi:MAG: hypothetical protein J5951_05925 [Bacteroidales bacterium]|nr:hypothetical protein [Bacteroidales bacterium]